MDIRQLVKILLVQGTHAHMGQYFPLSETHVNERISFRETSSLSGTTAICTVMRDNFHHSMTHSFSCIR